MTKLIVDPETDRVLGVGIVGAGAGEMIAEAMLAVEMAASARDVALTMHAHPTLSETVRRSGGIAVRPRCPHAAEEITPPFSRDPKGSARTRRI